MIACLPVIQVTPALSQLCFLDWAFSCQVLMHEGILSGSVVEESVAPVPLTGRIG